MKTSDTTKTMLGRVVRLEVENERIRGMVEFDTGTSPYYVITGLCFPLGIQLGDQVEVTVQKLSEPS